MCLNKIKKPPVWGVQGRYKDCRATHDDDDDDDESYSLSRKRFRSTTRKFLDSMTIARFYLSPK
jgi:hypothetical protein